MKSRLSKPLRRYFHKRLKQELPQFIEFETNKLPPGYRAYSCMIAPDLAFFIVLEISPKTDEFTFEGHICTQGSFPAEAYGEPYDELNNGELRFDLTRLWDDSIDAFWWHIGKKYPLDRGSDSNVLLEQTSDININSTLATITF